MFNGRACVLITRSDCVDLYRSTLNCDIETWCHSFVSKTGPNVTIFQRPSATT